jgi:hypothetical protein
VDNRPDFVEKIGAILEREFDPCGTLRHPAAVGDLTGSVGSARGPQDSPIAPSTYRSDTIDEALEALERLNATSERELLEGYGRCGRCGGTGAVARFGSAVYVDCPRCGGTGRKP